MRSFARLIETQIAKARASGALSELRGEGKPLPDIPIETGEAASLSAGMRMMSEAGVLPEEFQIKKDLDAARRDYATLAKDAARKEQMKKITAL